MQNQRTWDTRFMELAEHVAGWSKYPGRKVGAVIVDSLNIVRSMGYNGLPRGINDELEERYHSDVKYKWAEHAERNAIYNACCSVRGCRMYIPWFPCMDCARAIVQSGIVELISREPDFQDKDWGIDFKLAIELFKEAGVIVRHYNDNL